MRPHLGPILAIGILFFSTAPVFSQKHEVVYPNGFVAIAKKELPSKVFLAQKNTLEIRGRFFYPNQPDKDILVTQGSGFIEKNSGYVISARHLLLKEVRNIWLAIGEPFYIDKEGIPRGRNYEYKFQAILHTATAKLEYPLEVKAVGLIGTHIDVIAFKPSGRIPVNGLELFDNARAGDKVYVSGFTNYRTSYYMADGRSVQLTIDDVKYNFENTILAVLENETVASTGLKRLYRLTGGADYGFSGGPVLNINGQVVGIFNEGDKVFFYSVSSKDVRSFIKSIK